MANVIPILNINKSALDNAVDQMIYVLKFLMMNPGWTSSWYDNELLSMRKTMAEYTENSSVLVPKLAEFLNNVIHRFDSNFSCRITAIPDEANPNNYSIDIQIVDDLNNPIITLDRIYKDDSNVFTFKDGRS